MKAQSGDLACVGEGASIVVEAKREEGNGGLESNIEVKCNQREWSAWGKEGFELKICNGFNATWKMYIAFIFNGRSLTSHHNTRTPL